MPIPDYQTIMLPLLQFFLLSAKFRKTLRMFNKSGISSHYLPTKQKELGKKHRFRRYRGISFPKINGKMICAVVVKEISSVLVYYTDENKQEIFYTRRHAFAIDLKPSETLRYIKDHWK